MERIKRTSKEATEIFLNILEKLCNGQPERVNAKLNPTGVVYDGENEILTMEFLACDWEMNPRNILHGGITAAIFDTTMGFHAHYISEMRGTTTSDLSVSYIRPIMEGDTVIVKSYLKTEGRTLFRFYAEAFSQKSGKLIATGTGNYMLFHAKPQNPQEK